MPPGQGSDQRISLADKILEKIAEHEARLAGHPIDDEQTSTLPPKIIEVYTKSVVQNPSPYFPWLKFYLL